MAEGGIDEHPTSVTPPRQAGGWTPRRRATVALLAGAAALVLAIVGAWLWFAGVAPSLEAVEAAILAAGPWGVAASIGLMILHCFVPFPAELLAIANGMIFGPIWGVAITWTGAMLGAMAAFGLARSLGRPVIERMLARDQRIQLDRWVGQVDPAALLLARLLPLIAFNLVNYVAGLAGIGWWTFLWTTAVGILPMTIAMVVLGEGLENFPAWAWLLVGAMLLGAGWWRRGRHGGRAAPPRGSGSSRRPDPGEQALAEAPAGADDEGDGAAVPDQDHDRGIDMVEQAEPSRRERRNGQAADQGCGAGTNQTGVAHHHQERQAERHTGGENGLDAAPAGGDRQRGRPVLEPVGEATQAQRAQP